MKSPNVCINILNNKQDCAVMKTVTVKRLKYLILCAVISYLK